MASSLADGGGPGPAGSGGTVVVTGAASGMGAAVAELYGDRGWRVVGVDRDTAALETTGPAYPCTAVAADVRDRKGLTAALAPAIGDGVDVLVNAAGIYPTSSLAGFDEQLYRDIFDVNVLGTLNVTAVVAEHLRPGGAVVNFASVDAFAYSAEQLLYSASKAAVVSLTKSLAIELAPRRVAVNAIAPGWVDTPGTRAGGRMEQGVQSVPMGRAARPDEIAQWVWTLAGGSYLTGETLVVAGGVLVR